MNGDGVQVSLNGVKAAGDQLQSVRRVSGGDARLAGNLVCDVLDKPADRGQRAYVLVGEPCEDAGELSGRRGHRGTGGPRRGPGTYGDEVEILLDAARLVREASQDVSRECVPRAMVADQAGDQVETSRLCVDGHPSAAKLLAGPLDTGDPREPMGDFGPLVADQIPIVGMEANVEVEDRTPVVVRTGGERVPAARDFEMLGPLNG
ncbi:hypothetical protein [Streptomyces buecherae]|uniref:hypothetical protein n=1 Tax=Streptomyces buecherae TaxID=2763006 RepID=UPI0036BA51F7